MGGPTGLDLVSSRLTVKIYLDRRGHWVTDVVVGRLTIERYCITRLQKCFFANKLCLILVRSLTWQVRMEWRSDLWRFSISREFTTYTRTECWLYK